MCGAAEIMVAVPGGVFVMGSDDHYPEERPAHKVRVAAFRMDPGPVTNREFREFVRATGHVTLAERPANADDYPGADPAMLVPSSVVFVPPPGPVDHSNHYQWWQYIAGADWLHPRGPGSSIEGLDEHPVVHVAHEDAAAYAAWAGKQLPTEAEWEFAARGGRLEGEFAWGDELAPGGRYMANTFQGEFPWQNTKADGYEWTSPVGAFPANGYGLLDMIGNVWEWTDDWYAAQHHVEGKPCCAVDNPRGGQREQSHDPMNAITVPRRVTKGGSHLCAPSYCRRYRPAARMAQCTDTATSHLGFRCVVRG